MEWSGTGFSIFADQNGSSIITNKHICAAPDAYYELTDSRGKTHTATLIRTARGADLCLLHTNDKIPPVRLAQNDARQGDHVNAIGAPYGMLPLFTDGFVSGGKWVDIKEDDELHFEVHFYSELVSIPVYPGNSGSPVFNDAGKVVGVVFAGLHNADHMTLIVPVSEIHKFLQRREIIEI
jgi:serine protease Do